jgi:hypothetical protein
MAHQRKILKAVTPIVARLELSLQPLEIQCTVDKTYAMATTDDTPKGENFTISVCVKITRAIGNSQTESPLVPYFTVAAPTKPVAPVQPVPAAAGGKRDLKSLSLEEKTELTTAMRAVRLLEDWEMGRFMGLRFLKQNVASLNTAMGTVEKLNVPPMPKIVAQRDLLAAKLADLSKGLKEKTLAIDEYKRRLTAQAAADEAEAKAKGADSKEGKILAENAAIARAELDSYKKKT